jgi:hypothetical protein
MPRVADLLNYRAPQLAAGQVDRSIPMATPSGQFVPTPPTESQLTWEGALSNPSIANILYGAGETAYGLVTAPIPYAAGMVGAGYGALTGQDPRATGTRFEQATSFQPQSPTGQYYSEQTGEKFSSLPPVVSGNPIARLGQGSARYAGEQYAKPIAEKGLTMYEQGKLTPGMNPISQMEAWHGSPHLIKDKFNLEKVGTGEGAQMYGHGTYFATDQEVAKPFVPRDMKYEQQLMDFYKKAEKKNDYATMEVLESAMLHSTPNELLQQFPQQAAVIEKIKSIPQKGYLYKVDIPDEQIPMMLDWDKPLSQQPKLLEVLKDNPAIAQELQTGKTFDKLKGSDAYLAIASSFDVGQKEAYKLASENLRKLGVPGIRYSENTSRNKGQGTTNFVSFQPETVKILELNDKPFDAMSILYK